jgi:hypothetical protein
MICKLATLNARWFWVTLTMLAAVKVLTDRSNAISAMVSLGTIRN